MQAAVARQPVGRWTHTFSRCPVSVAVRSEAKLSPIKRAARATPAIRRRNAPQHQPPNALVFLQTSGMMDSHPRGIRSSWRCAWASPAKIKMNLNGLSSGVARVVERCKAINGGVRTATATTTSPGRELPSPQLSSSSSFSSLSSSSSCSSSEYVPDASATRVYPYSRSCR